MSAGSLRQLAAAWGILKRRNYFRGHAYVFGAVLKNLARKRSGKPAINGIELASLYACNYKCRFCSAADYSVDKQMRLSAIRNLLDQARNVGAFYVCLTGGEPLLRKDIVELVHDIRRRSLLPIMISNGWLLTPDRARELKEAGLFQVLISFYGSDETQYESFVGIRGAYETVVGNMLHARKIGVSVSMKLNPSPESLRNGDFLKRVAFARSHGFPVDVGFPARVGGFKNESEIPLPAEELAPIYELLKRPWCSNDTMMNFSGGRQCPAVRGYVYVSPAGEVMPCAFIPISFGNVIRQPLGDIVRSMAASPAFSRPFAGCLVGENREWVERFVQPALGHSDGAPLGASAHPHARELLCETPPPCGTGTPAAAAPAGS